jgi:predicted HTH transcriptional regulator
LIEGRKPLNAAILLFGLDPQRAAPSAITKCVHVHGTAFRRPFDSMQVFDGDVFAQADAARNFVLSNLNRTVGTRVSGNQAPASFEIPPDAVAEAVVNALAHRDYDSNGSVEVRLFSDRLEVWNPGGLPGTLTFASLRVDHASVPNNPLLAESMFLARYIERVGSGTLSMIELCQKAGLPEPDFELRDGFFVATLWRDWLTSSVVSGLGLNERQLQAIAEIKLRGGITNTRYQAAVGASRRTASRDLGDLVEKGVLELVGERRGSRYVRRTAGRK